MSIELRLRSAIPGRVDLAGITPDRLRDLSDTAIARLPVSLGSRQVALGDLFEVRGGSGDRVRIVGNLQQVDGIGASMTDGELLVEGSPGAGVGARMSGGRIDVRGDTGAGAGTAMRGGRLIVRGDVGPRLGSMAPGASRGMAGGEIVVHGSAGEEAGARMRRGLIVVAGSLDRTTGRDMIAGTIVGLGQIGETAGWGNKRGTIVAAGGIDVPPSYRYACSLRPSYLALLLRYVQRTFDVPLREDVVTGCYRRYCGDAGDPGKGEILEWSGT